jgi:hypothetical protein
MNIFRAISIIVSVVLLAALHTARSQPYTWTTIAGSPQQIGFADGTNSDTRFGHFLAIAADNNGDVFVGDTENRVLRKVTHVGTDWVVTTLAGGGSPHPPPLGSNGTNRDAVLRPSGIALDQAGNLFVAEGGGNGIRKITQIGTNWVVTTIAGVIGASGAVDGTNDQARFNGTTGIAIDSNTNLYVADLLNQTIRKLTPEGTNWVVTTIAGLAGNIGSADGTNSNARFNNPYNVAVDRSNNVYVADTYNATVRKIVPIGTNWVVTTIAGKAGVFAHVDGFGEDARFCGIGGITVDRAGRLYVAESCNYTIRKLTPVGTNWLVTTLGGLPGVSGTQDGTGSSARFYPWNVTVDDAGILYVADEWNYTVRRGEIAMYLRTARAANQLILSWPNSATNYVLETTSDLTFPWTPLTDGVGIFADDFVLTNAIGAGSAFFRLRKF